MRKHEIYILIELIHKKHNFEIPSGGSNILIIEVHLFIVYSSIIYVKKTTYLSTKMKTSKNNPIIDTTNHS